MYCKHCGEAYNNPEAVVCVKCGAPKGRGTNFCQGCGNKVSEGAEYCTFCGCGLAEQPGPNAKSKVAAGLLGILLGGLGVHNFYLGYTAKAVVQLVLTCVGILLTCVGVGVFLEMASWIWGLVEGILILVGKINEDGMGNPLGN